ncbi:MAG: hypothetical protein V4527_02470 [Pseudomonadota bacterium]
MSQNPRAIGVPWFRQESYDRIQNLPGSDLRDSFEQWEERTLRMFNVMCSTGQSLTRVVLEPDELLAFAKEIGADAITANVRAELANRKLEKIPQEEGQAGLEIFCSKCGKRHAYPEDVIRVVEIMQIACECGERLRKPSPLAFAQQVRM